MRLNQSVISMFAWLVLSLSLVACGGDPASDSGQVESFNRGQQDAGPQDGALTTTQCDYKYSIPSSQDSVQGRVCGVSQARCYDAGVQAALAAGWPAQRQDIAVSMSEVESCVPQDPKYIAGASGAQARTTLPIVKTRQQSEVWCWAAVIEIVSLYYGNPAYQCGTVSYWTGIDCCAYPSLCRFTGDESQIAQTLYLAGVSSQYTAGGLTWSQVKREIDAGRPFIIVYRGSFAGHVVVGYGYDDANKSIMIHDPYYGSFEVPYGATFSYNGSLVWSGTFYNFQKVF